MIIKQITFLDLLPIWKNELWPDRRSPIEPYSAMIFMHSDYSIAFMERPVAFFGLFDSDKLVGVNSVHGAEAFMARSRGLWVAPEYRHQGYGKQLLDAAITQAKEWGVHAVWSFSRKSSIDTYLSAGFSRTSGWLDHGEFGPNAYVLAVLGK